MIQQLLKRRRSQILIDVNTQRDLFLAQSSACVRNHRRILAHIRRVMAWARRRNIPIISTCETHFNHNGGSEISLAGNYCIDGTEGQKKISYTLLDNRVSFPADNKTNLPRDILRQYKQVILHKRCIDPFDEPVIERLLTEVKANEFILIGADAEGAVIATALGLLLRSKKVSVVIDAVGWHYKREAKLALRKMEAKGAKLIETKKIAGKSHLKNIGICNCESCQGHTKVIAEV